MSHGTIDPTAAPPRLQFHVPPRPSHLLRARDRIRDYLRQYCTEPQVIDDVVLCVEEAATNAIRHSGSDGDIEVSLRFVDGDLVAEVKDQGRGFDLASFDREALPDVMSDHGRGLYIVAKLMDSLELTADGGLEVRMTRRAQPRCETSPLDDELTDPRTGGGARTRAMLDELEEGFIALDWEYRYVHANQAALHLSSKTLEQLLGRTPWEVFPELQTARLRELYRQAMELGRPSVSELPSIFDDSWREIRIYPTISGVSAYFNDITERKRGELERDELLGALRDSEERYRQLFQSESDAILLIDHESGRLLEANAAAAATYGYTVQELVGLTDLDLSAEPEETRSTTQAAEVGENVAVPFRLHRRKDGTTFAVEMTGRVFSLQGRMVRVVAVRDVTARKRAEEMLGRFELLAANSRDIILFMDRDGRIIEANAAAERAYGYTRDELLELSVTDLRAVGAEAEIAHQMTEADERGILFETLHRRHDGSTFPVEVSSRGATVGGRRTLVSVVRDISERKRAEGELRDSEARFRLALRHAPVSVALQDRELRYVWAYNQRTAEHDEIIGKTDREIFTAAEAGRVGAIKRRVLDEGVELREQMWLERAGGPIFLDITWEPLRDEAGEVVGVSSATVDLTAIKRAEEALRDAEEKSHDLIRYAPTGIYEIDFRGPHFKTVNDAMCTMSGYTRKELLAMDPFDLLDAESQAVFAERIRRGLAGESIADSVEYRFKTKDGRLRDVVLNTTLTKTAGVVDGAFVVGHDVTERKLAESELRERDARLRALFENLQDGFYLAEIVRDGEGTPCDYRFLEVNRAFEELMSSDRARLVGQLASDAILGLDPAWATVLGEVADSGTPVRYCRYSKVFERWFEITAFRPAAGQVGVIVSDVTEQREAQARAEHEHQTLTAILEGAPAGALYLDREFTIRVVNRQVERDAGMTRARLIGRNYFEVMPEARLRRFLERARDAGRAVELSALPMELPARPDRGVTYWDWRAQPVANASGQVEGLVLSSIDVTTEVRSQRLSDALSRISLKLVDATDPTAALEGAGKLAVDALGCDTFLAARLDADRWTPLQSAQATPPTLMREPGRWPEPPGGNLDVSQVADWQADARVSPAWRQAWRLHACLFAPLVSNGRLTGGLFFGVRERPRTFDAAECEFARRCATVIAVVLDNMRLTGDLERGALTLQESLLRPLPLVRGLQLAAVSQPAHEADLVGGDFHDAFPADDDHVVLLVGDVTGKGLGAAGLTETVRTAVRAFAAIDHAPDYVMRKTSELLLRHEAARNQFVTAFMVTIDLRSGEFRYTSAGHPPAAQMSGAKVGYLPTRFAPPLGVWADEFPVGSGRLAVGDLLVLYTDGVTEARSARGMFGERRVLQAVRQCARSDVQEVAEGLRDAAVKFGGALRDDLEILAVRFAGRAGDTPDEGGAARHFSRP